MQPPRPPATKRERLVLVWIGSQDWTHNTAQLWWLESHGWIRSASARQPRSSPGKATETTNFLKNAVFWNIKIQFVPYRRTYFSPTEPSRFMLMYDLRFSQRWVWKISSSGMLRRVALVRADVSGKHSVSIIRVRRICELRTTLAVTRNRSTLRAHRFLSLWWWKNYVLAKRRFLQEPHSVTLQKNNISHSHRRENLKSYNKFSVGQSQFFNLQHLPPMFQTAAALPLL
jgi:hypothetical protein